MVGVGFACPFQPIVLETLCIWFSASNISWIKAFVHGKKDNLYVLNKLYLLLLFRDLWHTEYCWEIVAEDCLFMLQIIYNF